MLTQEYLKTILQYDPHTGHFTRLKSFQSRFADTPAGCIHKNGYVRIKVDSKGYLAHRLAFLYMTGSMPKLCDHRNRIKSDNRWENIRPATLSQNGINRGTQSNNKSGIPGVYWNKGIKKWHAGIKINNKREHLGFFDCINMASAAYQERRREVFGEFAPNINA